MKHEPSRRLRLTPEVFALRSKGHTLQRIANQFGVSKTAVSLYLSRTRTRFNKPAQARPCNNCGVVGWYTRGQDPTTSYCSRDCYHAALKEHPYLPNRHGQRLGRETVGYYYGQIPEKAVVHHEDGNCLNNKVTNLVLFASQSDHLKHHRNCRHDAPIWSGLLLRCEHTSNIIQIGYLLDDYTTAEIAEGLRNRAEI